MNKFSIKEEQAALKEYQKIFQVGTRVIFRSDLGGIWYDLGLMTGIIVEQTDDCMWSFKVELDHPELLDWYEPWNSTKSGGLEACVHGSALALLDMVESEQPDMVHLLNRGTGLPRDKPSCEEYKKDVREELDRMHIDLDTANASEYNSEAYKKFDKEISVLMKECFSFSHAEMVMTGEFCYDGHGDKKTVYQCPNCGYTVGVYTKDEED